MPNYFIPLDPPPGYAAAVICLNPQRPLWDQEEIEETLSLRELRGTVLLDTLLSNGSRGRRYFAMEFDGKRLKSPAQLLETNSEFERYSWTAMTYRRTQLDKALLHSEELLALVPGRRR